MQPFLLSVWCMCFRMPAFSPNVYPRFQGLSARKKHSIARVYQRTCTLKLWRLWGRAQPAYLVMTATSMRPEPLTVE